LSTRIVTPLRAFHEGPLLRYPAFSPAFENRDMPVSVPVNGNKRGAEDTFPRPYGNYLPPAKRAVKAIPVFKYPDFLFRQKPYNTHVMDSPRRHVFTS
jgi:hypothetical protein